MENNYKICILAAGVGKRMGRFTDSFNKALIPVSGKPAICHIIEKIPKGVGIVVATGHMREGIETYVGAAYPKRDITFVDVGNYKDPGSGPGCSLLQCRDHLQSPFIFFGVDTHVREDLPAPARNWLGIAEVPDAERFCSVKIDQGKVVRVDDKKKTDNRYISLGIVGVKDYEFFWDRLGGNKTLVAGEIQTSNGFGALMERDLFAQEFTWFDTGTQEAYAYALENYPDGPGYKGERVV